MGIESEEHVLSPDHNGGKEVHFGTVLVREYVMTMGINPATSIGAPVCLTWEYREIPAVSLDSFEKKMQETRPRNNKKNRSPHIFYLNYYQRMQILERAGFSKKEFDAQERKIQWDRAKRKITQYQSFPILFFRSFFVAHGRRKARRFVKRYRKKQKKLKSMKQ